MRSSRPPADDIVLTERVTGVPLAVINTPYVQRIGTRAGPLARMMLKGRRTKHLMRTIYAVRSAMRLKQASTSWRLVERLLAGRQERGRNPGHRVGSRHRAPLRRGGRLLNRLIDPTARLVIAHRGASAEQPENTMAAFRRAVELGADAIELDVRLARDGVPVVIHDATLDRTTSATGARSRHAPRTSWQASGSANTTGVPRLEQVLRGDQLCRSCSR